MYVIRYGQSEGLRPIRPASRRNSTCTVSKAGMLGPDRLNPCLRRIYGRLIFSREFRHRASHVGKKRVKLKVLTYHYYTGRTCIMSFDGYLLLGIAGQWATAMAHKRFPLTRTVDNFNHPLPTTKKIIVLHSYKYQIYEFVASHLQPRT